MNSVLHRSRILGMGAYAPERVVTNDDLKQWYDTNHEWIIERTGISERRWIAEENGETNADLAVHAATDALADAGVDKEEIDMVVYATLSPDHAFPGTGVFFHRKMGFSKPIPCLDIRQQCTGFVYAMSIADQFIKTGMYKKILVVGSEIHSTGMDRRPEGRDVGVLFGDGAGVVVLGVSDDPEMGVMSTHLYSDGNDAEILWIENESCAKHPRITHEDIDNGSVFADMAKALP